MIDIFRKALLNSHERCLTKQNKEQLYLNDASDQ